VVTGAHPARRGHPRPTNRHPAWLHRPGTTHHTRHNRSNGSHRRPGDGPTARPTSHPSTAPTSTDPRRRPTAHHTDRV